MKHIILVLSLLAFSSCARAYIQQWGNGRVVACCANNACSTKNTDELARQQCGGDARMLGGHLVNAGAQYVGYGMVQNVSHACYDYECESGPSPASISPSAAGGHCLTFKNVDGRVSSTCE